MSTHTTASLPFDAATVEFDPLLRRLNLASTRRHWRELLQRAETHGWSCREFLGVLVTEEIAHRQHTRVQRAVRQARFPFLKTIEEFDFSLQSSLRLPLLGSYLAPELVTSGLSLILKGKSGRGKTHLAIAIAYRAIQQGFTARFVTAAALIEELSSASRQGKLQAALTAYLNPNVLIVDEVGYLSYGPDAANVLFHVVNERHLRGRSMLFTTNKSPLTAWGAVLHDADLAEAIVDRILERGRLMLLDGPSYRTQHLDLDVEGAELAHDEPARISGKHRPEFPEPTVAQLPISVRILVVVDSLRISKIVPTYVVAGALVAYMVGQLDNRFAVRRLRTDRPRTDADSVDIQLRYRQIGMGGHQFDPLWGLVDDPVLGPKAVARIGEVDTSRILCLIEHRYVIHRVDGARHVVWHHEPHFALLKSSIVVSVFLHAISFRDRVVQRGVATPGRPHTLVFIHLPRCVNDLDPFSFVRCRNDWVKVPN